MDKNITIVIDGQAGSSGKGKICGYFALKDNFYVSVNNLLKRIRFVVLSFCLTTLEEVSFQ